MRGCFSYGRGTLLTLIELPKRPDKKEKTYSFHLGTVDSLKKAREYRDKANAVFERYSKEEPEAFIHELKKLKEQVKSEKPSKEDAVRVLKIMKLELEQSVINIDFRSENSDEIEKVQDWKERDQALSMAIAALEKQIKRRS